MADKTCPVKQTDGGVAMQCGGESCAWYLPYPDGGGACATTVLARRLQVVVDAVVRMLAHPERAAAGQSEEQVRATSQNPVWEDRVPR